MTDRLFVNIYEYGRSYGGPEEGGWWFDTGVPIGSIPVDMTIEERQSIHSLAIATHGEELPSVDPDLYKKHFENYMREKAIGVASDWRKRYPETGKASSVLGGEDYRVYVEDHFAQPFPQERPHYE